jgi:hypothetical protein
MPVSHVYRTVPLVTSRVYVIPSTFLCIHFWVPRVFPGPLYKIDTQIMNLLAADSSTHSDLNVKLEFGSIFHTCIY